ncbi:MAG: hypothetical protein ACI9U2_003925, partial [Bradymonadia bacterium]
MYVMQGRSVMWQACAFALSLPYIACLLDRNNY